MVDDSVQSRSQPSPFPAIGNASQWPESRPLVALGSAHPGLWPTLMAEPTDIVQLPANSDLAAWRDFAAKTGLTQPLRHARERVSARGSVSGWVFQLSFELGEVFEPAILRGTSHSHRGTQSWPLALAFRVVAPDSATQTRVQGVSSAALQHPTANSQRAYEEGVRACLAYIRSGDVYQVNLAHALRARLHASTIGSRRAFANALWCAGEPLFAAHLELPGASICSASPELFLQYSAASQRLSTRPMKGTRVSTAHNRDELARSEKDRAELAMIVDLMRNDLGRVCSPGSMRVDTPYAIEQHGSQSAALLQATATVSGEPTHTTSWADVLEACFPPGSVTGAPKVRAVQIIRELEPTLRGPYCGCIGFVSDTGDATWSVAIRTACVQESDVTWHVGAGIVAESDPQREWEETLAKAGVLRGALGDTPRAPLI